jgi:nucleotide-binding universal stress UspA family protein
VFTRILVPIDLSPSSEAALEVARQHFHGATIRLLHIIDQKRVADTYKSTFASPTDVANVRKKLEGEALGSLQAIARQDEDLMVVVGKAAELILDHAQEWKPDLIVMGTHGRTGIAHFLNGSVAESVVREARLPVLIVHEQTKLARQE